MPTTVTMPQLGETVTEGTILRWAKNVGDPIATDEILVEISTDKVDTEVPSPAQGVVIELLVGEGETVAVGTALAVIGEAGEAPGADGQAPAEAPAAEAPPAEAPPPEAPTPEPAPAPVEEAPKQEAPAEVQTPSREVSAKVEPSPPVASDDAPNRGVLSPVVRKLARDQGIDLGTLTGSGEGGRITRRDVEAAIASQDQPAAAAPAPTAPAAESAPAPVAAPPTRPAP
ncbi:MAG: biotin/lipoyl-containing protein, partial [Acidimicrobiia bacterium]